ncbi:MAG: J domain-containing protein [Pseudomonadota bacterium]
MRPDHYATLGIESGASAAEVRAAYLRLLREHHPDRNPNPDSGERAKAIIAAFKVLGDFDQRNHYDWDRRRDREAAEASASARESSWSRRVGIAAVGVGLTAMGAWLLVPDMETRRAAAARTAADAGVPKSTPVVERITTVIRMRPAAPKTGQSPDENPSRSESAGKSSEPEPLETLTVSKDDVRMAASQPVLPVRIAAKQSVAPPPSRQVAPTATDIDSLDQFVMNFYGQSWRYGDAPKRAVLENTKAGFVARRGACTVDDCRRNAYLDLMRDVSSIVETGKPEPR